MLVQLGSIVLSLAMLSSPVAAHGRAERDGAIPVASIVTLGAEHDGATVHLRSG
jgi:hypothetical protein